MALEKDVVRIWYEENPIGFARIEAILPDPKPDWYQVRLLLLQEPLQLVTWILRERYINGDEFTMGGNRMRLEPVMAPPLEAQKPPQPDPEQKNPEKRRAPGTPPPPDRKAKVISFQRGKTEK